MNRISIPSLLLSLLCFLAIAKPGHAQVNTGVLYSNYFNLPSSRYLPAILGEDNADLQVSVGNVWLYGQNSSLDFQALSNLIQNPDWQHADISSILESLKTNNSLSVGLLAEPLNIAIRFKRNKKKEWLTLGFGVADRAFADIRFSKTLAELAWHGNAEYEGQVLQLGPLDFDACWYREYYLALAFPIIQLNATKIRIGGRIKGIQGLAAVQTEYADGSLYTDVNGGYVELAHNYAVKTAVKQGLDGISSSGRGWGYDVGIGAILLDRLHVYGGIIGSGNVFFNKNVKNYSSSGQATISDGQIDNLFDELQQDDSPIADELLDASLNQAPFSIVFNPQLVLQAAWRKPGVTLLGNRFYKRSLFVTYVQDFAGEVITTDHAMISVGYSRNFASVVNVGLTAGLEDMKYPSLGAFAGLRVMMVRIGASSANLLPLLWPSSGGKHADMSLQLSLAF